MRTERTSRSEPMAFGLGAGLAFFLVERPGRSPSRALEGRAPEPDRTRAEVLGDPERPLPEAVAEALKRQARDFLLDVTGLAGASALERFAEELPRWPTLVAGEADRAWTFRCAHDAVARPPGGGLWRGLYASFLEEAEGAVPGLARLGLAPRMRALAAAWTRLAEACRALSEIPGGAVPPPVAALVASLARDERRYHEDVAAWVR